MKIVVLAILGLLVAGIVPAMACPAGTHPVCSYDGGEHSHCHCE